MASGKKATEAVLFSVTSELSWATCCEQGDTESWDLLGPQSWLPGVSRVAGLQPLRSFSSHWCFEGPPARRASASTKGLGASAALLWGLAGQGASQQLDMWGLNFLSCQEAGPLWVAKVTTCLPICQQAGSVALCACSSARPLLGTRAHRLVPPTGHYCAPPRPIRALPRLWG